MALGANRSVSRHWVPTVMSRRKMCESLCAALRCVLDVFHSWVRVAARWLFGFVDERATIVRSVRELKVNKCEMTRWSVS